MLEVDGEAVRRCYTPELPFEVDDQRSAILRRNFVFGLAAVRRERFLEAGGFDESIRYATDWDLWARLILDGSRVGAVMEPLARYRLRAGSLSGSRANLLAGRVRVLEKAAAHPSLSDEERRTVAESIALERRRLALAEARAALEGELPHPRRRSLRSPSGAGTACRRASRAWPRRSRRAGRQAGSPPATARRPAASAYLRAEKDRPALRATRAACSGAGGASPAGSSAAARTPPAGRPPGRPDRDRRSDPPFGST